MCRVRRRVSIPASPGGAVGQELAEAVARSASCWAGAPGPARSGPGRRPPALVVGWRDPVVADMRVGEADDLPGVGGIGEDLLIAGQRGVEHHLAAGGPRRVRAPTSRWPRPRRAARRARTSKASGSWCRLRSWRRRRRSSLRLPVDDDGLAAQDGVADPARQRRGPRRGCCGCGWPGGGVDHPLGWWGRSRTGWRGGRRRSGRRGRRAAGDGGRLPATARPGPARQADPARSGPGPAPSPDRASRAGPGRRVPPWSPGRGGRGRWRWRRRSRRPGRP